MNENHNYRISEDGTITVRKYLAAELPTVVNIMKSGRTTYRFIGSYDGCRSLPAKLLTHTVNFKTHKQSYKSKKKIDNPKEELVSRKRTVQKSENRLVELDRLFKHIYEDMVNGRLSEARFQMLSDDYEKEQAELWDRIELQKEEIERQEDQAENVDRFIRTAKKYLHLEKLTPTILNDIVNAVYVHAPDKSSGHRIQDVEISYNYAGILPATLLYDLQNDETA